MIKVIKATATEGTAAKTALTKVASYCRVSTDSADQETSFESQQAHYLAVINANPAWTLAGIYADEGISGTQAKKRPEFQRLIDDCEAGKVDLILTKSISRFSRNTIECLTYVRQLKELNIPVIFEKEGINTMEASGELLLTILASLAQGESESISHNVRLGIRYGFQQGKPKLNSTNFLGYDTPKPHTLAINPEQAKLVRRIYRLYLEGLSPDKIARKLTSEGIPTVMGCAKWSAASIQGILTNEKYCGDVLMQKYYVTDFITHRLARNEGQLPQYFVENNHDPIVPKYIWTMVQGELRRRAEMKIHHIENIRVECAKCGGHYRNVDGVWRPYNPKGCGCKRTTVEAVTLAIGKAMAEVRYETVLIEQTRLHTAIAGIDEMLRVSDQQQAMLEETKVAGLEDQINSFKEQRQGLYRQRAELVVKEMNTYVLLDYISHSPNASGSSGTSDSLCSQGMEDEDSGDNGGACSDVADFFKRTSHKMEPKDLIEKVKSGEDGLIVVFKAGVEWKEPDSTSSEG